MHAQGFFAVVLDGSYVEAGDTGRHRVSAGDVIVHHPFEGHLDRFSIGGASVLVLPLTDSGSKAVLARVDDADAIARTAERDVIAARQELMGTMVEYRPTIEDWPDLLARDLMAEPDLSLGEWADRHCLHPGSLGRGFGQQFDISPAGFRTMIRSRRAVAQIVSTGAALSAIASEQGFADQAHMSRAVKRMTGHTPHGLRRLFVRPGEKQAA
jgi:AraC-like DNA-binding protein